MLTVLNAAAMLRKHTDEDVAKGRFDPLTLVESSVRLVQDVAGERCEISLPEKDRPDFGAAHRCMATHFLTGDRRHFGPFMNRPKETMGIVVQTVGDILSDISK